MTPSLRQYRLDTAVNSGGISSFTIKNEILKIIKNKHLKGRVLDYGAGKGELLELLDHQGIFDQLSGSDILERPENLDENIAWYQQDLNDPLQIQGTSPDLIICSEVIEHLENPRATFRQIYQLLDSRGYLLLTTPNQESIRSYCGLFFGGHFTHFLRESYPAHITALLRLDLTRICHETGFEPPTFHYTNQGGIPKMPSVEWQKVSFGLLKGRLFSDNILMLSRKK